MTLTMCVRTGTGESRKRAFAAVATGLPGQFGEPIAPGEERDERRAG